MKTQCRRGLVAISGDPVTFGHLDLVAQAATRCRDELVVAVLNNDKKVRAGAYLFDLKERTEMTLRAVRERQIPKVRVIGSSGLLVDIYLREGCDMLFRGVRDAKDRVYEKEQKELNQLILPSVKFTIVDSAVELRMVSSSMVKEFVSHGLDVDRFVPLFVKRAMEERLLGQYRIAVTGPIAVGKSWVAAELVRQVTQNHAFAGHFNLDDLVRKLYSEESAGAQRVRDDLAELCEGHHVLSVDRANVDRKVLAALLFREGDEAAELREAVTALTMPHIARLYREMLRGFKGLVVLEWAQLAEMSMGAWTNHNVVVVDSPDRALFLERRGIDVERMRVMEAIQWSAARKASILGDRAAADGGGEVIVFQNALHRDETDARKAVTALRKKVFDLFPGLRQQKT